MSWDGTKKARERETGSEDQAESQGDSKLLFWERNGERKSQGPLSSKPENLHQSLQLDSKLEGGNKMKSGRSQHGPRWAVTQADTWGRM